MPEVAIDYGVAQNKRTLGSSFEFVIQQRFWNASY